MPVSRRQGLPKLMAPFLKLREDKIDTTPVFEGLEDIIYTVPRSKPKFEIDMIGRESHTVEQMVPAQSAAAALEIILLAALRTGVTIREVTTTSPIHTRVGFPAEIMRVDELLALFLRKGSLSTARTAIKRFRQYIEANQNAIRRMYGWIKNPSHCKLLVGLRIADLVERAEKGESPEGNTAQILHYKSSTLDA
ncbi:hypothetical protein PCE1_004154 [Barthelona sp. PCE]